VDEILEGLARLGVPCVASPACSFFMFLVAAEVWFRCYVPAPSVIGNRRKPGFLRGRQSKKKKRTVKHTSEPAFPASASGNAVC
jgi:hypothetical protein